MAVAMGWLWRGVTCGSGLTRNESRPQARGVVRHACRANKLKARMAAVLAASINAKSDVASAKARARVADATKGEATSGETTDALVAITPTEPPVTTEDIEQAVRSLCLHSPPCSRT